MAQGLAIVGYGKMGKLIESLAPEYGFEVRLKLDVNNNANFEGISAGSMRQSSSRCHRRCSRMCGGSQALE
jgi:hypothetical protein